MSNVVPLFATRAASRPDVIKHFEKSVAELTVVHDALGAAIKKLFVQLDHLDAVIAVAENIEVKEKLRLQALHNRKMLSQAMYELSLEFIKVKRATGLKT